MNVDPPLRVGPRLASSLNLADQAENNLSGEDSVFLAGWQQVSANFPSCVSVVGRGSVRNVEESIPFCWRVSIGFVQQLSELSVSLAT